MRYILTAHITNNKNDMKKILITILTLSVLLSATACNNKWDRSVDLNMSEEDIKGYEDRLEVQFDLLKEDSEVAVALFEIGFIYQQLGDYKKAVKFYKKKLELDKNDYATLNNLSVIYERVEEYELAAKYIKRLYEKNPDYPEAIRDTVRILLKAGDPKGAAQALENYSRLMRQYEGATEGDTAMVSRLFESIREYEAAL